MPKPKEQMATREEMEWLGQFVDAVQSGDLEDAENLEPVPPRILGVLSVIGLRENPRDRHMRDAVGGLLAALDNLAGKGPPSVGAVVAPDIQPASPDA